MYCLCIKRCALNYENVSARQFDEALNPSDSTVVSGNGQSRRICDRQARLKIRRPPQVRVLGLRKRGGCSGIVNRDRSYIILVPSIVEATLDLRTSVVPSACAITLQITRSRYRMRYRQGYTAVSPIIGDVLVRARARFRPPAEVR